MRLVQILLPLTPTADSRTGFEAVLSKLTDEFGGATAFLNSPAEGLWRDGGTTERDRIVTVEVMVDDFDQTWWKDYRQQLEKDFRQEDVVVRVLDAMRV